jgi:hypothetical protein
MELQPTAPLSSLSFDRSRELYKIASAPLDRSEPLLQRYPAMKLGERESVGFYAELLVPFAGEAMADHPELTEWVLASPPFYANPAAANLLAAELHRRLAGRIPASISLRVTELRYRLPDPQCTIDTQGGHEYSKASIEERVTNRRWLHEGGAAPRVDPAIFEGRGVLFVNDINVTGAQQFFLRKTLKSGRPAGIEWLFIVQVDPDLGRSNPSLEHELNTLHFSRFEDVAALVAHGDVDLTARCVRRFLAGSEAEVASLAVRFDASRLEEIVRMADAEGAYTSAADQAKLELLRRGRRGD